MKYSELMYIVALSTLVPVILGICRWKNLSREMCILLFLLFCAFVTDLSSILPIGTDWFINWVIQFYGIFEYLVVMSIILLWQESKEVKFLLKVLTVVYIVFWGISKLTFEPIGVPDAITSSVSRVILVLCAGYALFVTTENRSQPLLSRAQFWVLLSFLLYFTGTLMPLALQGILLKNSAKDIMLAWSINWILAIISNILYSIGFLCPPTQT